MYKHCVRQIQKVSRPFHITEILHKLHDTRCDVYTVLAILRRLVARYILHCVHDQNYLTPMTPVDARTLSQATASVIRKSLNSQKVSIVLPSMRPSAPPMSHISDSIVYPSSASMYVYFSSEKNICNIDIKLHDAIAHLFLLR